MTDKMCNLKPEKYCELKDYFTALELRQTSFEARQANNEHNIAEIKEVVARNSRDISEHLADHKLISERINVNTQQLLDIKEDIQPIVQGVHTIQESVKVLGWISKIVKWISVTLVGTGLIVYSWTQHIQDFFKGHH